jgi:hypothetical protein
VSLRFYGLLLVFSAILPPHAMAEDDPVLNFRERCRRTISSGYGTAIADSHMADDALRLAENFRKKSLTQIEVDERRMRELRKKIETTDYSPELLSERDVLASKIKVYHEQLVNSESQIAEAKKRQLFTKKRQSAIRSKVEAIFNVEMAEDPEGLPRPIFSKISWKSECPKYRALCPLPEKDNKILVSILDEIDDAGQACMKYSKIK